MGDWTARDGKATLLVWIWDVQENHSKRVLEEVSKLWGENHWLVYIKILIINNLTIRHLLFLFSREHYAQSPNVTMMTHWFNRVSCRLIVIIIYKSINLSFFLSFFLSISLSILYLISISTYSVVRVLDCIYHSPWNFPSETRLSYYQILENCKGIPSVIIIPSHPPLY